MNEQQGWTTGQRWHVSFMVEVPVVFSRLEWNSFWLALQIMRQAKHLRFMVSVPQMEHRSLLNVHLHGSLSGVSFRPSRTLHYFGPWCIVLYLFVYLSLPDPKLFDGQAHILFTDHWALSRYSVLFNDWVSEWTSTCWSTRRDSLLDVRWISLSILVQWFWNLTVRNIWKVHASADMQTPLLRFCFSGAWMNLHFQQGSQLIRAQIIWGPHLQTYSGLQFLRVWDLVNL